MAATASKPHGRTGWRSRLRPRPTLRLRLTLLYGLCFLVSAGGVLALTNVIVAHLTANQTQQLTLRGTKLTIPASPLTISRTRATSAAGAKLIIEKVEISPDGNEQVVLARTSKGHQPTVLTQPFDGRYSREQLATIQSGQQALQRCMRARGLTYPTEIVARGANGRGLSFTPQGGQRISPAETHAAAFKAALPRCIGDFVRSEPTVSKESRLSSRQKSSLQQRVGVVIDRANNALDAQRSRSLATLRTWSGLALGVMAIISMVLGWLVAGRGLRPMHAVTARARQISETNLHERLSPDTTDDELGDLASTFDDMLARLERAFEAQQQFVANASHELRTPVTLERTLLEIALSTPDADADALRHTCERVLASTKQQHQMIEALLVLARSQGGSDVNLPADLSDLAHDAIALREKRLHGLTVTTDLHPAQVTGDPSLLERLVANLIDNATVHNQAQDGWITVETATGPLGSRLRVSNSGPEIPETKIPELFQPFRRNSQERSATNDGAGLGLSIVRAIADLHGATVRAQPLDSGGLCIEVSF